MSRSVRSAAATLPLVFMLASGAGAATLSLEKLKGFISDLGYESTTFGDTTVGIADQGKYKQTIYFQLSGDHSNLNIYAPFDTIAPEKLAAMPSVAMLKANNASGFAYAISEAEGKSRIDLEAFYDVAVVNKTMLRRTIDELLQAVDSGEPLWNADTWTAQTASTKTLDEVRQEYEALWNKSPLRADHAMFVTEKAPIYGGFTQRPSNVFKPGTPIIVYAEPKSYTWKPVDAEQYSIDLGADLAILNTKDETQFEKKAFFNQSFTSHDKINDFMLNLTLDLDGFPAGDYKLRYTLHDKNSDKSVDVVLPFKVAN